MIKIMSFNIRHSLANDGDNCWDNRKSLVIARIQAFEPDLLGIQECRDDAQAEFLKNNLPEYQFYGVRRGGGGETSLEMAPLLFRNSDFQLVQKGHFWLSQTPHLPGSKSWEAVFARTATWVELKHQPSNRSLLFLNTHFDYQNSATGESARLLQQWVFQTVQQLPIIITGDFNADKNSFAYQQLTENGLLFDLYHQTQSSREKEATFHGYGQPTQLASIDWILASHHFKGMTAAVDQYHEGNLYPSDHYPVTAMLNWKA